METTTQTITDRCDRCGNKLTHMSPFGSFGALRCPCCDDGQDCDHGPSIDARLEYLRGELRAERISYGELAELQSLTAHIDPDDVELLQWAGVDEFGEDREQQARDYNNLRG